MGCSDHAQTAASKATASGQALCQAPAKLMSVMLRVTPLASLGPLGMTTLIPGTCVKNASGDCEW